MRTKSCRRKSKRVNGGSVFACTDVPEKPVSSSKALPIKRGPVISTPSKGASPGPVSEHDVEQESRQTRSSKLATHRWLRSGSTNTTVTQAAARLRERMHKTMRSKVTGKKQVATTLQKADTRTTKHTEKEKQKCNPNRAKGVQCKTKSAIQLGEVKSTDLANTPAKASASVPVIRKPVTRHQGKHHVDVSAIQKPTQRQRTKVSKNTMKIAVSRDLPLANIKPVNRRNLYKNNKWRTKPVLKVSVFQSSVDSNLEASDDNILQDNPNSDQSELLPPSEETHVDTVRELERNSTKSLPKETEEIVYNHNITENSCAKQTNNEYKINNNNDIERDKTVQSNKVKICENVEETSQSNNCTNTKKPVCALKSMRTNPFWQYMEDSNLLAKSPISTISNTGISCVESTEVVETENPRAVDRLPNKEVLADTLSSMKQSEPSVLNADVVKPKQTELTWSDKNSKTVNSINTKENVTSVSVGRNEIQESGVTMQSLQGQSTNENSTAAVESTRNTGNTAEHGEIPKTEYNDGTLVQISDNSVLSKQNITPADSCAQLDKMASNKKEAVDKTTTAEHDINENDCIVEPVTVQETQQTCQNMDNMENQEKQVDNQGGVDRTVSEIEEAVEFDLESGEIFQNEIIPGRVEPLKPTSSPQPLKDTSVEYKEDTLAETLSVTRKAVDNEMPSETEMTKPAPEHRDEISKIPSRDDAMRPSLKMIIKIPKPKIKKRKRKKSIAAQQRKKQRIDDDIFIKLSGVKHESSGGDVACESTPNLSDTAQALLIQCRPCSVVLENFLEKLNLPTQPGNPKTQTKEMSKHQKAKDNKKSPQIKSAVLDHPIPHVPEVPKITIKQIPETRHVVDKVPNQGSNPVTHTNIDKTPTISHGITSPFENEFLAFVNEKKCFNDTRVMYDKIDQPNSDKSKNDFTTKYKRPYSGDFKPYFTCKFCPYYTHSRASVSDHIYNHTAVVPYTCQYCLACFGTRNGVTSHQKKEHPNDKPFYKKTNSVVESDFYINIQSEYDELRQIKELLAWRASTAGKDAPHSLSCIPLNEKTSAALKMQVGEKQDAITQTSRDESNSEPEQQPDSSVDNEMLEQHSMQEVSNPKETSSGTNEAESTGVLQETEPTQTVETESNQVKASEAAYETKTDGIPYMAQTSLPSGKVTSQTVSETKSPSTSPSSIPVTQTVAIAPQITLSNVQTSTFCTKSSPANALEHEIPVIQKESSTPPTTLDKFRYKCRYCVFFSNTVSVIQRHVMDEHEDDHHLICCLCDMAYCRSMAGLKTHFKRCHPNEKVKGAKTGEYIDKGQNRNEEHIIEVHPGRAIETSDDDLFSPNVSSTTDTQPQGTSATMPEPLDITQSQLPAAAAKSLIQTPIQTQPTYQRAQLQNQMQQVDANPEQISPKGSINVATNVPSGLHRQQHEEESSGTSGIRILEVRSLATGEFATPPKQKQAFGHNVHSLQTPAVLSPSQGQTQIVHQQQNVQMLQMMSMSQNQRCTTQATQSSSGNPTTTQQQKQSTTEIDDDVLFLSVEKEAVRSLKKPVRRVQPGTINSQQAVRAPVPETQIQQNVQPTLVPDSDTVNPLAQMTHLVQQTGAPNPPPLQAAPVASQAQMAIQVLNAKGQVVGLQPVVAHANPVAAAAGELQQQTVPVYNMHGQFVCYAPAATISAIGAAAPLTATVQQPTVQQPTINPQSNVQSAAGNLNQFAHQSNGALLPGPRLTSANQPRMTPSERQSVTQQHPSIVHALIRSSTANQQVSQPAQNQNIHSSGQALHGPQHQQIPLNQPFYVTQSVPKQNPTNVNQSVPIPSPYQQNPKTIYNQAQQFNNNPAQHQYAHTVVDRPPPPLLQRLPQQQVPTSRHPPYPVTQNGQNISGMSAQAIGSALPKTVPLVSPSGQNVTGQNITSVRSPTSPVIRSPLNVSPSGARRESFSSQLSPHNQLSNMPQPPPAHQQPCTVPRIPKPQADTIQALRNANAKSADTQQLSTGTSREITTRPLVRQLRPPPLIHVPRGSRLQQINSTDASLSQPNELESRIRQQQQVISAKITSPRGSTSSLSTDLDSPQDLRVHKEMNNKSGVPETGKMNKDAFSVFNLKAPPPLKVPQVQTSLQQAPAPRSYPHNNVQVPNFTASSPPGSIYRGQAPATGAQVPVVQCGFCSQVFRSQQSLEVHMFEQRESHKGFICPICSYAPMEDMISVKMHFDSSHPRADVRYIPARGQFNSMPVG